MPALFCVLIIFPQSSLYLSCEADLIKTPILQLRKLRDGSVQYLACFLEVMELEFDSPGFKARSLDLFFKITTLIAPDIS